MLKFTVPPTAIVALNGLKMFPGVKTSTGVGPVFVGFDVASLPPQPTSRTPTMMTNRRIRPSIVKVLPTQYRTDSRTTSRWIAPVIAVLVMMIAACGGDSATGPQSVAGTYGLTTVGGKALPYRMFSDVNYTLDIAQGSIALRGDGSFVAALRSEERVENHLSVYADTATGTWVLSGSKIDLTTSDGMHQSIALGNHTLTVVDSSAVVPLTYVYSMQ
jgi:hypothetical protein